MTPNQITKTILKAGLTTENLKIERDEIEVCVGYYETTNGSSRYGHSDERKTRTLANKIKKLFPTISNESSTQYGAIRFMFNFTRNPFIAQNID